MIFYLVNVVLSFFILDKRYAHFSVFIVFNTLLWVALSEPYLDIQTYVRFFGMKYGFEAGYHGLTSLVLQITGDRLVGLKLTQAFFFILGLALLFFVTNAKFRFRDFLIVLALFSNSIFFKLGNFNVFRQYIACLIAIGALGVISNFRGIVFIYMATLFHKTSVIFILNFIARLFTSQAGTIAMIIISVVGVASLKLLLGYTRYGFYLQIGEFEDRANSLVRLLPVILFFASSIFMRRKLKLSSDVLFRNLFKLNIVFFSIVFLLSFEPIFNEIQSRVIFFYFFIALLLYCRALCLTFNVLIFSWFIFFNAVYPSAVIVSTGGVL